ncbi:hypothetical protein Sango_2806500 [Sesamum angolense]|uniref:Reverse transcriptase zinc-binding domain-containing protein n=1 Tax=Sesamum angolense TaxID=2727404 RepID=A0AAE1T8G6_9LAMI|nr:hypothetical protein Sango_2806500 [Sesamum angolense]
MEPISYYWHGGDWNVPRILRTIPMPFAQTICQIPIAAGQGDKIVWTGSSTGDFSTTSTWEAIRQASPQRQLLADVWHHSLRPTILVFLWRLFQDRIPVDAQMQQKGSTFHLIISAMRQRRQFSICLLRVRQCRACGSTLLPFLGFASMIRGASLICGMLRSIMGTVLDRRHHLDVQRHLRTLQFLEPPVLCVGMHRPRRWFKLNTDGSSLGNPGLAGAGGIIRDSAGHVHLAYQFALGTGTSVLAELTAVWRGEANDAADHLAKEAAYLQLTRVLHHDDITGVLRGILCLDRQEVPHLRQG